MSKTKRTGTDVPSVDDPFERLPEHILHRILALIWSNKVAARIAVVSKSWHRAWSSYPIFDFHVADFHPRGPLCPYKLQIANDRLLDFVDKAMSRLSEHKVAIPRFTVCAMLIKINHSRALFDKWIGMAVDSCAQELYLKFIDLNQVDSYSVPARIFNSGSIKSMTLVGRGLITPLDSISTVNLSSLQSLEFYRTPLDESMLQKLLRGCPLLEKLLLFCCKPLTQVIISGPNSLREIFLTGHVNRVEIEAPGLEVFDYNNSGPETSPTQVVLDNCPRVKNLKLGKSAITEHRFQELLSKFPLLESIQIGSCQRLGKITILNPLLKSVEIEGCKGLVDIEIGSANLSCFRYTTTAMLPPFIRMQNPAAISVREAYFQCNSIVVLEPSWFIELREFLTRSCQFRYLRFDFDLFDQGEGNVLDTGDPLPLLPYDIVEVHLSVNIPRSSHAGILNKLLSLFHPTYLTVSPFNLSGDFLKFLCEKLENRGDDDDVSCCCSGHRKCWLHELKAVEIFCDDEGPVDWRTVYELLPDLEDVYFVLHWK